jgi:molybdopterin/thiamine biosynthesis adenylyltransferase
MFRQSIWLQRAARNQGKYYFFTSAIGFGALVVIFSPNGMTLEEFDNLPAGTDINTINNIYVPLERVIPVIPSYAPASTREALMEIYAKAKAIPTTSIGVGLASILAANEAINIILNKRHIPTAPEYIWVDLLDQQFMTGKIA